MYLILLMAFPIIIYVFLTKLRDISHEMYLGIKLKTVGFLVVVEITLFIRVVYLVLDFLCFIIDKEGDILHTLDTIFIIVNFFTELLPSIIIYYSLIRSIKTTQKLAECLSESSSHNDRRNVYAETMVLPFIPERSLVLLNQEDQHNEQHSFSMVDTSTRVIYPHFHSKMSDDVDTVTIMTRTNNMMDDDITISDLGNENVTLLPNDSM